MADLEYLVRSGTVYPPAKSAIKNLAKVINTRGVSHFYFNSLMRVSVYGDIVEQHRNLLGWADSSSVSFIFIIG